MTGTAGSSAPRRAAKLSIVVVIVLTMVVTPIAAQETPTPTQDEREQQIQDQFSDIADLLILVIGAVAVPNGAFGLLQWMTAGANEEKLQKGKKRIRNTFIALAGAAVIKAAVGLIQVTLF